MNPPRPSWFQRFTSWLPARRQDPVTEARRQLELAQAQHQIATLQKEKRLLESSSNWDYWLSAYVDILDRYRDGERTVYPISQPTDRRYGQNFPFWTSEQQLSLIRAQSRLVCTMNAYAIGLLSGLTSYVIGEGLTYRAVSDQSPELAKQVQDCIDEFCGINSWAELEQELFWRSREDGEYFLRFFQDDNGCMIVRTVEPEQITKKPDGDLRNWSFGINTDAEDVQQVESYWIKYLADSTDHDNEIGEEVTAEEMAHLKINVKRTIKRGLTDFWADTFDGCRVSSKLSDTLGEGASVQSAIAQIRKHNVASQSQVQSFVNQNITFSQTNPITQQPNNFTQLQPGSIIDIPSGMEYVDPPGYKTGVIEEFIQVLHANLRKAGQRWNTPEWLSTGSGAEMAAYTASLAAHAPFVKTGTRWQGLYKTHFKRVILKAIRYKVQAGQLPPDVFKLVEIQVEAPRIEMRDELQQAQANQIRVQGGWKSQQTVCQEEGGDWEQEQTNIEAAQERGGGLGDALQLPPEEILPNQNGNGNGNRKGNGAKKPKPPKPRITVP